MRREDLLVEIERLKLIRRETEGRQKGTIQEAQLRALNEEILKIARQLESLDRIHY